MTEDHYYKKTITFNAWKRSFKFKTSQELFSSHDIDTGTRQLLRTIIEAGYPGLTSILDLGCGYGPVGLTLKALFPDACVHLVDKDALALEYTRQNAELNRLDGLEVYRSLGYDDLKDRDFDMIISNIPGKAGEPVIAYLLREAGYYLSQHGISAVVVVNPLVPLVTKILAETAGVEILFKHHWADHSVFHYRFAVSHRDSEWPLSAVERGIYTRHKLTYHFGRIDYPMDSAFGLADFDSLGNENELLFNTLKSFPPEGSSSVLVFNPGQGHSAVMLWKVAQPQIIRLVDRDLLALRYSQHNLILNHCPPEKVPLFHQIGMAGLPEGKTDFAVVALREEEGPSANLAVLRHLESALTIDAVVLVSGGSTAITRLADNLKQQKLMLIKNRERWRGQSLLVLTRR